MSEELTIEDLKCPCGRGQLVNYGKPKHDHISNELICGLCLRDIIVKKDLEDYEKEKESGQER